MKYIGLRFDNTDCKGETARLIAHLAFAAGMVNKHGNHAPSTTTDFYMECTIVHGMVEDVDSFLSKCKGTRLEEGSLETYFEPGNYRRIQY